MSEPAEWKIEPVKHQDGSTWVGLAYIDDGARQYGAFNEQQAIAICEAHNAATAKLRAEMDGLNRMLRDRGYGQGEIDAYVAQCEEMDKLKAQWHEEHEEMADYIAKLRDEIVEWGLENAKLREENERLKEALQVIKGAGYTQVYGTEPT